MQTIDIKEVKQEVVDKMEQYKQEFIEFMVESDVLKFGEFTLKSGRKSPFFMNAGAYVTGSQLMRLGEYYAKAIHEKYGDDFDVLFGPAYKGIPISVVTAVAFSKLYGKEVRYCSDRKEEKDHGADKGSFLGSSLKDGDRVVMIEDVTTSGKSMEETVPKVRGAANVEIVGLMDEGFGRDAADVDACAAVHFIGTFDHGDFPVPFGEIGGERFAAFSESDNDGIDFFHFAFLFFYCSMRWRAI